MEQEHGVKAVPGASEGRAAPRVQAESSRTVPRAGEGLG